MKGFIAILLFTFSLQLTYCQTEGDVFFKEKFIQYQQKHLQEKIYVHTDKDFYLAGETVWFKLYDVDASFHKPFLLSGIAYVEIIDSDQRPLLQAAINLGNKSGSGSGSFIIPASALSGNYRLRAYTNRMKNFSEDFYFEKTVTIINTIKPGENTRQASIKDSTIVMFYPEGGNLVTGLISKVAFKICNQYGAAIIADGFIINEKRDTVTVFHSNGYGTGTFNFKPQHGSSYKAVVNVNRKNIEISLPVIYESGYTMSLEDAGNKVKITARTNYSGDGGDVYLLAHTRQILKSLQTARFSRDNEAVFFVDKNVLAEGVSHFTIFNGKKKPVCERLFFKRAAPKVIAGFTIVKDVCNTRDKVDVDINLLNESGKPVEADMSASVFLIDSLQQVPAEDIASYLLLTSEFKERIQLPTSFFSIPGDDAIKVIDEIMLTSGWRRFRWEDVLNSAAPYFEFLPEYSGQVINGKVISRKDGLSAEGVGVFLSVPGKNFTLANAVSNSSGDLKFVFNKVYGKNEFIFQPVKASDSNYSIEITPPYSKRFSAEPIPLFQPANMQKGDLLNRSIYMQVENTYNLDNKHIALPVKPDDTTAFYGYGDRKYYLDDYTRFLTMEEVIKEYVAEVIVKKQADKFYLRVKDKKSGYFFDNDPLILIDGMPVYEAGKIMVFDPLKIKSIDIVSGRYFQSAQSYEGIISFKTYEGDLANFELNPNSVVVEYDGIQQQQEFYSPVYQTKEQKENRLPDFRNVLYWNPSITTGAGGSTNLSFYSSDYPGEFGIFLQGISKDGLPVSAFKKIAVIKK